MENGRRRQLGLIIGLGGDRDIFALDRYVEGDGAAADFAVGYKLLNGAAIGTAFNIDQLATVGALYFRIVDHDALAFSAK